MRPITAEEVSQFWADGVVHLQQVLDAEDVTLLDRALTASYDQLPAAGAYYDITAAGDKLVQQGVAVLRDQVNVTKDKKGRFTAAVGVWMLVPAVRQFIFESGLPKIAAALLRSRKVNLYDDQVLFKAPLTEDHTAFHQDQPYFNVDGNKVCVIWASPDLITGDMGPMQYVRGSHLWGPTFKPNFFVSNVPLPGAEGEDQPDIEADRGRYDIVTYATKPGDVIVHHYKTIHGSHGNASPDRIRRAISVRYCGDDVRYHLRPSSLPQPHHVHTLREGDQIDSEAYPVVWRSEDALGQRP
jgi:ectoine hydroxylase-related dioxygenase (phytanoyl-CoA dioxygenase family)